MISERAKMVNDLTVENEQLKARIAELENKLAIDTLSPNRREYIISLENKITELEAENLKLKSKCWKKADTETPVSPTGLWSRAVVAVTNYDRVCLVSFYNGNLGGCWQMRADFEEGEEVEWWIDQPHQPEES